MILILFSLIFSLESLTTNISQITIKKLKPNAHGFSPSLSFHTKKTNIAGQTITRSIPLVDNIVVEGADGIRNDSFKSSYFQVANIKPPHGSFRLNAAECTEIALKEQPLSIIQNPYVENINGLYQQLWLMHYGEMRPAFKIRLPTISIFDLKDIYVDADNGDILRVENAAQFAEAPSRLFVYSPRSSLLDPNELKPVMLKNLVSVEENGFLHGEYINVRTCCKYYTCPEEGPCNDETKRCALKSHPNALQTRELLELPTKTLGLDPIVALPETISVNAVRCTYLPFARASFKDSDGQTLGFFEDPLDDGSLASEMNRFSEVQAYFSMMSFFNNIRSLLNDKTWCLREEAMSCNDDGSPVIDSRGFPKNPYKVFVNQLIPDMKIDEIHKADSDSFLAQAMNGKGTRDNPIELNHFARIGNAAFVPALSTLTKNPPRADEILSDLIKPYDHNVFFLGERNFAYDGDVVFHEFMHAITTSLVGKLNSLGLDHWGINSEPGGLNESWSDYFAAAFTDDPVLGKYASTRDGYGETGLRNIENNASCPHDVIGEIHNDGLIWSGALWEVRTSLKKSHGIRAAVEFDRAVLSSLAESKIDEDFKTQSEKLIRNIQVRDGLGDDAANRAKEVFDRRGITDCFRAYPLSHVDQNNKIDTRIKNFLFVASKNQIGLKNYAPSSSQLEIAIPAGAKGLTISWRQYLGGSGALLGAETTPDTTKNIEPLKMLTSLDVPITWKFQGARAVPYRQEELIETKPKEAVYRKGYWHVDLPLDFGRCEQRVLYASILSSDFKYVLENVTVNFDMDNTDRRSDCIFSTNLDRAPRLPDLSSCVTTDAENGFIMLALLAIMMKLRKRPGPSTPHGS